jgi:hypothetical protein
VKIGPELKISDLEIVGDWGEQAVPGAPPTEIIVVDDESSSLAVFCNPQGIPAIDEFGYTKYVNAPLIQINDKIVTRSSREKSIEVALNPSISIVQYGLMGKREIFANVFRSNFVKPYVPPGTAGAVPINMFVFVNSLGYPLVSPSNEYIQVENFVFEPPLYVKYTENFVTEYSYIPEDGILFVPNKIILNVKTYPNLFLKTPQEKEHMEISSAIKITLYRYNTGDAYIQYTITQLGADIGTCGSLRDYFSGISETEDLLKETIRDIRGLYSGYKTYAPTIYALETRDLIADTSNNERMVLNIFDLKLKEVLNKVYNLYTEGKKPVIFFKSIVKKIDKIRKGIKELQDVKSLEVVKSVTSIQTIVQNQSILKEGSKSDDLTALLNKTTGKKVEFDAILKALDTNINTIPKDLNDLESWVQNQEILIDNARSLHKEIIDLDNVHTVEIFTHQLMNNIQSSVTKMKENTDKMKALVEYKKKIAFWLDIYPDLVAQKEYADKPPLPTTVSSLKAYTTIQFLPFEELENPFVKRDWYPLADTDIFNASTRTRITFNIVDPMKTFIEKTRGFYIKYDIIENPPEPETLQKESEEALQKMVEVSDKVTNVHILAAVEAEGMLEPILKEYKNIRADLHAEIEKLLNTLASTIQSKWLDSTGKRTAIQTNIALLQPYLNESQTARVNKMNKDMEDLFSSDKLSVVDDVQRSLKVPDYYANTNYLKMLEMDTSWSYTSSLMSNIQDNLSNIQSDMEPLQTEVLANMQTSIKTGRGEIKALYDAKKSGASDAASLKTLTSSMDPRVSQIMEETSADIPTSISLMNKISSLKNELKT